MSESKARRFLKPGDPVPGRREPQVERRVTGWRISPETGLPQETTTSYIIGHGQQLARERLGEIEYVAPQTGIVSRQNVRAAVRKQVKAAAKKVQRDADKAALKAMREKRQPHQEVTQGPGKLLFSDMRGRRLKSYDKSRGKAFRSVVTLAKMPNGDPVPAGKEATFHATKGLRLQQVAA